MNYTLSFKQFLLEAYAIVGKGLRAAGAGEGARPLVVLDLGVNRKIAFYQSSKGTSGKITNKWYPFFGAGGGDYVLKGSVDQMERGYDSPEILSAMKWLNDTFPLSLNDETGEEIDFNTITPDDSRYGFIKNPIGMRAMTKLAYGSSRFKNLSHDTPREVHAHINKILTDLGLKQGSAPEEPVTPKEVPAVGETISLEANGQSLNIKIKSVIGKSVVGKFGEDSQFWSEPQFTIDKTPEGGWMVTHDPNAANATMLNGKTITGSQALSNGNQLAVGNEAKGVIKLPLTVTIS
jgi:hypothetical protein